MKRTELLREVRRLAKQQGVPYDETEGGRHTKVSVGHRMTTVPRRAEINELTARGILKYMKGE